jgi:hypothetical protein
MDVLLQLLEAEPLGRPRAEHVYRAARKRGVQRPDALIESMAPLLVDFAPPLSEGSGLAPTVRGVLLRDSSTELIHHRFMKVIRALPDRWDREGTISAAEPQPVVMHAFELLPASETLSLADRCLVGRLLEVEGVGSLEWTKDRESPWSVWIRYEVHRYAGAVTIEDFLRIGDGDTPDQGSTSR